MYSTNGKGKRFMKFELNEKEIKRSKKFYQKCKKKLKGADVNMYYLFYTTGIGNGVKVGCKALDIEKDITDLDNW